MAVELASFPADLNPANPPEGDPVSLGAGHIRLLKGVIQSTFPNVTGQVTSTQVELNNAILTCTPAPISFPYFQTATQAAVAATSYYTLELLGEQDRPSWQAALQIDAKLDRAGDTMTGQLNVPRLQIVDGSGSPLPIIFSSEGIALGDGVSIGYNKGDNRVEIFLGGGCVAAFGTDGIHTPGDVSAGSLG